MTKRFEQAGKALDAAMRIKQHYRIIDATTGVRVPTMHSYYASTPRGAIRMFRQRYQLAHNYPNVVAVLERYAWMTDEQGEQGQAGQAVTLQQHANDLARCTGSVEVTITDGTERAVSTELEWPNNLRYPNHKPHWCKKCERWCDYLGQHAAICRLAADRLDGMP